MTAIDRVKDRLNERPGLSYDIRGNKLEVAAPSHGGFAVWLSETGNAYTVGFDGWHEEFTTEAEALNCFALGLSDKCRLKVVYRGRTPCSWTLESRKEDRWVEDSTIGLLLVPFWRKRTIEYRRNQV